MPGPAQVANPGPNIVPNIEPEGDGNIEPNTLLEGDDDSEGANSEEAVRVPTRCRRSRRNGMQINAGHVTIEKIVVYVVCPIYLVI